MNHEFIATNRQIINTNGQEKTVQRKEKNLQNPSKTHNHLETIETFAKLLLQEVKGLAHTLKSEDELIKDFKDRKFDLYQEVQKYEVELIRCALMQTKGNQRRAAKLLKVKISTLNNKIKRYGIIISGSEFGFI